MFKTVIKLISLVNVWKISSRKILTHFNFVGHSFPAFDRPSPLLSRCKFYMSPSLFFFFWFLNIFSCCITPDQIIRLLWRIFVEESLVTIFTLYTLHIACSMHDSLVGYTTNERIKSPDHAELEVNMNCIYMSCRKMFVEIPQPASERDCRWSFGLDGLGFMSAAPSSVLNVAFTYHRGKPHIKIW